MKKLKKLLVASALVSAMASSAIAQQAGLGSQAQQSAAPALNPQGLAAIAAAVNDNADARAKRAAAPQFAVFTGHTSAPETLTPAEIIEKYSGETIFLQPAKNGAKLKSCAQFKANGSVLWNTEGKNKERRFCPSSELTFIPGSVKILEKDGKLAGFVYDPGTGPVVTNIPNIAISGPEGFMSLFIVN